MVFTNVFWDSSLRSQITDGFQSNLQHHFSVWPSRAWGILQQLVSIMSDGGVRLECDTLTACMPRMTGSEKKLNYSIEGILENASWHEDDDDASRGRWHKLSTKWSDLVARILTKTKISPFMGNWEMEVNSNRLPSPYNYKSIGN